uniref:Variant surface glycoprotein 1125.4174 n=1 Tax=Trypanosoma brucei TaxID=5691 RepID=A0A1J0RA70_9TRYP|nr:variant surface glycoprotein 1125.4174 [Trypanosoma brucei]
MAKQFEHLYAALLLFLTVKGAANQPTPEEAAANTAAATICTIDAYYEAISAELESWLTQVATATEALAKQQQLLALAALRSHDEAKKRAYIALGQIVAAKITANVAANAQSAPAIVKAVEITNMRRAEQAVSAGALAKTVITGAQHAAAEAQATLLMQGGGASRRICTASTTAIPSYKLSCKEDTDKIAAAKQISKALHALNELVTFSSSSLATHTTTVVVETVGDTTSNNWAAGSGAKHCDKHNDSPATAAATTTGLGVASLTITTGATRKTLNIEETRNSKDDENLKTTEGERKTLTSDKELVNALYAAIKAKPATRKKLTSESLTELAATPIAISIYNYLTNPGTKLPTETPTAEKVAQLIFGKSKGDVGTEFLKPLESDSNSIPTSDKPITGPTTKIAAENYNEAMAYYTALNLKKTVPSTAGGSPKEDGKEDAADKTGEKKDGDKKDEVCTATEEGKCDKTKCDWNAEKKVCKVKEGTVIISAVTKVPLLLAVLLLA